ncbi:hypothetical protein HZS_2974 [Henneguya salminicola]|nr:hypothetical protein HZS_2974 [Henneguya salminicola]
MLDSRKEFHAIFDNEELAIIYLMQMEVVQAQTVHTFCQGTISLDQVLETDYYWPFGIKRGQIETVLGISNVIVTTIAQNLRKLVSNALDFNNIIPGDDGIILTVPGYLGRGVERSPERRLFLVEVTDRTPDTPTRIIQTHILPNSIFHTKCFRSYFNRNLLYDLFTVNHSETW